MRKLVIKPRTVKRLRVRPHINGCVVRPPPPRKIHSAKYSEFQLLSSGLEWLRQSIVGTSAEDITQWERRANGSMKIRSSDRAVIVKLMEGELEWKSLMPNTVGNLLMTMRCLNLAQLLKIWEQFVKTGGKKVSSVQPHLQNVVSKINSTIGESVVSFVLTSGRPCPTSDPFSDLESRVVHNNMTTGGAPLASLPDCMSPREVITPSQRGSVATTIQRSATGAYVSSTGGFPNSMVDVSMSCIEELPCCGSRSIGEINDSGMVIFSSPERQLLGKRILFILGFMANQQKSAKSNDSNIPLSLWWFVSSKSSKSETQPRGLFLAYPGMMATTSRPGGRSVYCLNAVFPPMLVSDATVAKAWDMMELQPDGELATLEPRVWEEVLVELNNKLLIRSSTML
eukprot:Lankesteria_metandrocarpae@DN5115_c0_g1_i3.p1